MSSDWWETAVLVGRWTNIVLATAALAVTSTAVRRWKYRSAGNRFLWLGVIVFLGNAIFGTLEQIHQGVEGGYRVAIHTVAIVYVLIAVILKRMGRWRESEIETLQPRRSLRNEH